MSSSKRVHWLPLGAAFILLLDLSYSGVHGVYVGLDSSWQNAITRASELHLNFGRDIVFTYGPLGYFFVGTKTPESFRHIVFAEIGIAMVFSSAVVWYCSTLSLPRFLISIAAITMAMTFGEGRSSAVVGTIVAIGALALDRRSRHKPYEALIVGILVGIGALTKFTIAVQCAAAIGSVLVFSVAQEIRDRRNDFTDRRSLAVCAIAALATMGSIFTATATTASTTSLMVFTFWMCCILALLATIVNAEHKVKRSGAALSIASVIALALFFSSGAREFVSGALQISSGYSDAMNFIPENGGASEAALGVLVLVLVALVAMFERPTLSFGAVLGLVALGWLNFKEGYVRQDHGHVAEFLFPLLFIFALLTATANSRRALSLSLLAFCAVFFGTVVEMLPSSVSHEFALSRLSVPLGDMRDALGPWPAGGDPFAGMAADTLDAGTIAKLSSLPIDIEPYETTVAFANGLAWNPEPVFQSYSAYTPVLDRLDADALATGHRRVLVDMTPIDNRDFMEESPLARRALLCDYGLDPQFGRSPIQVEGGERFVVLSYLSSNRCNSGGVRSIGKVSWGRDYVVPPSAPGSMTFLALQIHYSLRGSIVKTAFRGPLVTIYIRDRNGTITKYRLLTQNATNGFLISPNPLTTADFARLFDGTLPATTVAFSIHTDDPGEYRDGIDASFETVSFARR